MGALGDFHNGISYSRALVNDAGHATAGDWIYRPNSKAGDDVYSIVAVLPDREIVIAEKVVGTENAEFIVNARNTIVHVNYAVTILVAEIEAGERRHVGSHPGYLKLGKELQREKEQLAAEHRDFRSSRDEWDAAKGRLEKELYARIAACDKKESLSKSLAEKLKAELAQEKKTVADLQERLASIKSSLVGATANAAATPTKPKKKTNSQ